MSHHRIIKEQIKSEILKSVSNIDCIISATIVGSFIDSIGIKGISDIDIIIIVDNLTKKVFDEINSSFDSIKSSEIGLEGYDIIVNNTFGPLKFNSEKNVVFHLMVYDIDGHINHVEQSPFTCFSWEEYNPIKGLSLKEIYPVVNLQLDDIIESRRGILSYIDDIENGVISYRRYEFNNNNLLTIKDKFKLDSIHKLEYSYHISYHLLNNLRKILTREFRSLKNEELFKFYIDNKILINESLLFFEKLFLWKKKGGNPPPNTLKKVKLFINDFFSNVEQIKSRSIKISFIRHERTKLNDGKFLGIKRDPSILSISKKITEFNYQIGYHSELKRSKETIKYFKTNRLIENSLLNEIDYGLVEGLTLNQLIDQYPKIIKSWKNGKDPKFPNGESQKDVLNRIVEFLNNDLNLNCNSLVITHLVVLRMILFYYLNIDFKNLFKIKIKHLEGFDIFKFNNYFMLEIPQETRSEMRKQLSYLND